MPTTPWTCTVCDITTTSLYKETHLLSIRHLDSVAVAKRVLAAVDAQDNAHWRCTTCAIDIHVNDKAAHLAGRRHALVERGRLRGGGCDRAVVERPVVDELHQLQQEPVMWSCPVCGVDVDAASRQKHVYGQDHMRRMEIAFHLAASPVARRPVPEPANVETVSLPEPHAALNTEELARSPALALQTPTYGLDPSQHIPSHKRPRDGTPLAEPPSKKHKTLVVGTPLLSHGLRRRVVNERDCVVFDCGAVEG